MKIKSIGSATVIQGLFPAAVAAAFVYLVGSDGWLTFVVFAVVFFVSALVTGLLMRKFMAYKLKPIFQIALSKNLKTSHLERQLSGRFNTLEKIQGELEDWAEKSMTEIARLKENEKYRKEYIGNVSHEMKTPIFNIQGYILTLLDGALEDKTINRQYLERAEKSIDRLINIVTDLDEISRLESGVLNLNMEPFDIIGLARESMEAVEMEAHKKNIRIMVGNYPGIPLPAMYVMASKHYISQVFINLLINSVKYGVEGGTTKISFIDLFDKVMVEVSDNGVGIAREDIPRVFERFYRTDKSRSREQGGTGLGLSIVKHIIEAHKESITLRSEVGKGSTFSFTLSKS